MYIKSNNKVEQPEQIFFHWDFAVALTEREISNQRVILTQVEKLFNCHCELLCGQIVTQHNWSVAVTPEHLLWGHKEIN